ncbi:pilin, partial [Neisseria gonorrhoeae]
MSHHRVLPSAVTEYYPNNGKWPADNG